MLTELKKIAENKSKYPDAKHMNLICHVNENNLKQVFKRLDKNKAVGIDGVNKEEYEEHLSGNLKDLVERMKIFFYHTLSAKRKCIPKVASDKLHPLGKLSLEDKMVQGVMSEVLNAIYESLFYPFPYGFRPNKDRHQAIGSLTSMLQWKKVNYVVDADIKGFFDNVDHKILMKFLEEEIEDKSFLRYIVRFLKAERRWAHS